MTKRVLSSVLAASLAFATVGLVGCSNEEPAKTPVATKKADKAATAATAAATAAAAAATAAATNATNPTH